MSPPRVIFVNRFYWPDQPATAQLLKDLAEGLARSGLPVTVLSSQSERSSAWAEQHHGVQIQRIRTSGWGRHNLVGRALDFSAFLIGARKQLRAQLNPQDIVVTMTDPPLLGPAVANIIRQRGARWVHWIQDIFPEIATAVSGRSALDALVPWRDRSWCAADHCVVPGLDMSAFVQEHGVPSSRVTVSANWAPAGLQPTDSLAWRQRHGLAGRFIVMYSGNLGRVHDFSAIVPLARAMEGDVEVVFVFIGEGAQKSALQQAVTAAGLKQVLFLPAQAREALPEVLSAGDVHLVTLKAGCERLVFPSKLYGIAAVGRPALVIGPSGSEPSRTVAAQGFGTGCGPEEIAPMAAFIRRLQQDPTYGASLGQAALRFSESHGQLSAALESWTSVLAPLIQLAEARSQSVSSELLP